MNGTFYQNPTFPTALENEKANIQNNNVVPLNNINYNQFLDTEQSYIENILRLNRGKEIKAYVSYPDSVEWKDKIYEGIIEQAGRDHLVISDPSTGNWYLIRLLYLNYVEFKERINYDYPFATNN